MYDDEDAKPGPCLHLPDRCRRRQGLFVRYSVPGYDAHDALLLVNAMQHWLRSHLGVVDRELQHCVKPPLS